MPENVVAEISGKEKAAILILALGKEKSAEILQQLHEDEIRELSITMAGLGAVKVEVLEAVCREFSKVVNLSHGLIGSFETTEDLLKRVLPQDQVERIMEDIRGPVGKTMWEKLDNVSETVLANYLRNEYPQTAALILSKLQPAHAANVITLLPDDYAADVMMRMLHMDNVQKDVLDSVESTLRTEFIATLGRSKRRNSYELLAEVFNSFDRKTETRLSEIMDKRSHDDMEKVKSLMFTFDDIRKVPQESLMRIVNEIDRNLLPMALKGASETVRDMFFQCMSKRASGLLKEEIEALGPVKVKDVDVAQAAIVVTIKNLANDGEIELSGGDSSDEFIT